MEPDLDGASQASAALIKAAIAGGYRVDKTRPGKSVKLGCPCGHGYHPVWIALDLGSKGASSLTRRMLGMGHDITEGRHRP